MRTSSFQGKEELGWERPQEDGGAAGQKGSDARQMLYWGGSITVCSHHSALTAPQTQGQHILQHLGRMECCSSPSRQVRALPPAWGKSRAQS